MIAKHILHDQQSADSQLALYVTWETRTQYLHLNLNTEISTTCGTWLPTIRHMQCVTEFVLQQNTSERK